MTDIIKSKADLEPINYAKNGYKYDKHVTAMMVEDMLFNPILAAKVFLSLKIPPHEELRILTMWTTHTTLDDSGFSTGKSITYAIVAALRSILLANRISGILSGTFRQGKLIFQYFDRWHSQNKIFRHCVKTVGGKVRLVHGQEAFQAYFRGGSEVRVLPPAFLTDSERLRSERWNDGYFDEWTTFGNFKAFTSTIIGRVTAVNSHAECPVRQNHLHLSSTPNFTHHPSYRIVKRIQANIDAGNTNYARMTFNYRHVPKTTKWAHLVNRKVIFSMQTMNSKGVIESEVDGLWTADSMSYYNSPMLDNPRLRHTMRIQDKRVKNSGDVFLAAFDMARGKAEGTGQGNGDDFAMSVLRIPEGQTKPQFCFAIRKNNVTAEQAAAIVQEYHQRFQFTYVMYDPGGGGLFVRDELRKSEITIRDKKAIVYPIIEMTDSSGVIGDMILIPFRRSSFHIDLIWGKMQSDSVLVNRMHQNMRSMIENCEIVMPPPWEQWQALGCLGVRREVDYMRDILNGATSIPDIERAHAETDLALRQLVTVDVERDEQGAAVLDKFQMYKFKSKEKKDLAYSLVYACTLYLIWQRLGGETGDGEDANSDGYCASSNLVG